MLLSKRLYWTCDKFSLLQTPGPWLDNIYISHQNPREAHSSSVEWQQHSSDTDTRQSPGPHVTIITELWRANMGLRTSWSTDSALHSAFCWVLICRYTFAQWSQATMFHFSPRIIKIFRGRDEEKQHLVGRPCVYIYIPGAAGGWGPANLLSTAEDGGSDGNVRARF